MTHGVVLPNMIMAQNVDSLNRAIFCADDLDNGSVVVLARSTTAGALETWDATKPATAALTNLWMIASPEIPFASSGSSIYRNMGNPDPREFYNRATKVADAFKPMVGDIITLTADALGGTKSTNGFVVAVDGEYKLTWAAAAISGLSLKLIATVNLPIPAGTLADTQRVTAYQFEVVAIA